MPSHAPDPRPSPPTNTCSRHPVQNHLPSFVQDRGHFRHDASHPHQFVRDFGHFGQDGSEPVGEGAGDVDFWTGGLGPSRAGSPASADSPGFAVPPRPDQKSTSPWMAGVAPHPPTRPEADLRLEIDSWEDGEGGVGVIAALAPRKGEKTASVRRCLSRPELPSGGTSALLGHPTPRVLPHRGTSRGLGSWRLVRQARPVSPLPSPSPSRSLVGRVGGWGGAPAIQAGVGLVGGLSRTLSRRSGWLALCHAGPRARSPVHKSTPAARLPGSRGATPGSGRTRVRRPWRDGSGCSRGRGELKS